MINRQLNRRTLPLVALIASALVFLGALVFALRPPAAPPPPAAVAAGPATPTAIAIALPAASAPAAATVATTPTPAGASLTATSATRPAGPAATIAPTATPPAVAGGQLVTPTAVSTIPPTATALPAQPPPAPPAPTSTPVPAPVVQPPAPAPTLAPARPTPTLTPPPAPPVAGPPPSGIGVPLRVRVPSLGIDAAVEQVGIDADGNMATPQDPWNTAWYAPGARPGQPGNAAIAGHVDYHNIGQVVFWDLNKLGPGDEVFVETTDGITLRFVVRDSVYYRPESAPLQEIFGPTSAVNLNLITCGGAFNPTTRSYDQRLVVFTTYVGR